MLQIKGTACTVLKRLRNNGYEAYLVGGSVRDMLMGIPCSDTDITTSALPEQVKTIFSEYRLIETGIKHGTVTVIAEGTPVEITTFRKEKGYSDGRHPDSVIFTDSLTADLSRRDFTVNSIAYCPDKGITDPFGGQQDIKDGCIRCVGDAEERFTEDSLRILRALRFASVLGFSVEEETEKAIFNCAELLKTISPERCFSELKKLLCGKNVYEVLMKYAGVISQVIPELEPMINFDQHNYHHKYTLLEHTAVVTQSTEPTPILRLAALFHDIGKPHCMSFDKDGTGHFYKHASIGAKIAEEILLRLHCDKQTLNSVVRLIKIHDAPINESPDIIKKKLRSIGEDMLFSLIKLQRADTLGLADEYHSRLSHFDALEEMTRKILKEQDCFTLKGLALNGNDMLRLGYKDKEIGRILNLLLEQVIEGKVENTVEALTKLAQKQ